MRRASAMAPEETTITSAPRARSAAMSAATPSSQAVRGRGLVLVDHQRAADLHDEALGGGERGGHAAAPAPPALRRALA